VTEQLNHTDHSADPAPPPPAAPTASDDATAHWPLPAPPAPPAPSRQRRRIRHPGRWLLAGLLSVLVAAGLAVTGWLGWDLLETFRQDPTRAAVGDCLAGTDDPGELRRVSCDAADATWRVAGREPGLTWSDFQALPDAHLCAGYPDTELAVWYGDNRDGGTGDVFCLETLD
jgi:hypothetical protein